MRDLAYHCRNFDEANVKGVVCCKSRFRVWFTAIVFSCKMNTFLVLTIQYVFVIIKPKFKVRDFSPFVPTYVGLIGLTNGRTLSLLREGLLSYVTTGSRRFVECNHFRKYHYDIIIITEVLKSFIDNCEVKRICVGCKLVNVLLPVVLTYVLYV